MIPGDGQSFGSGACPIFQELEEGVGCRSKRKIGRGREEEKRREGVRKARGRRREKHTLLRKYIHIGPVEARARTRKDRHTAWQKLYQLPIPASHLSSS